MGAADVARQEQGIWSSDSKFAYPPDIPVYAVKRWREPAGYEHVDQAPHLMPFHAGDRVVYGHPGETGIIVRPAHYLMTAWL